MNDKLNERTFISGVIREIKNELSKPSSHKEFRASLDTYKKEYELHRKDIDDSLNRIKDTMRNIRQ